MNYCSHCGGKVTFGPVPDDDRPRFFCDTCNTVHYQNPNMIVGCLPRWEDKVLLCKRAIEPRCGLWTLPAGFLEIGEKVEEGALRETREEANADVEIVRLFSVYNLPRVGQVYLIFLADLRSLDFRAGKESQEVRLFKENEIPWQKMAFGAIKFTLEKYFESQGNSHPHHEVYLGSLSRPWS
ncbi:MAG: NUDIX hydrolase [bacterium]